MKIDKIVFESNRRFYSPHKNEARFTINLTPEELEKLNSKMSEALVFESLNGKNNTAMVVAKSMRAARNKHTKFLEKEKKKNGDTEAKGS